MMQRGALGNRGWFKWGYPARRADVYEPAAIPCRGDARFARRTPLGIKGDDDADRRGLMARERCAAQGARPLHVSRPCSLRGWLRAFPSSTNRDRPENTEDVYVGVEFQEGRRRVRMIELLR